MDLANFKASLAESGPPDGLPQTLQALWYSGKGDWSRGHDLINDEEGQDEAWVHAHLHRVEGDLSNAGYWYRRAGRPQSEAPLEQEWDEIAQTLLARS